MKAIWNNQVIAESNATVVVENNHYFPNNSVNPSYLKSSGTHTTCRWKGLASVIIRWKWMANKTLMRHGIVSRTKAGCGQHHRLCRFLEGC